LDDQWIIAIYWRAGSVKGVGFAGKRQEINLVEARRGCRYLDLDGEWV
jgi:hypothetical protein